MNNIFRFITVVAFAVAVLALILAMIPSLMLGGITNYDSLHLRSAVPSDNALEVENYSGTDQLVIYGSGGLTIGGTSTFSGAGSFSSTLGIGGLLSGESASFSTTFGVLGESQLDTLVHGGGELSMASSTTRFSSSTGAYTMTAADICNNSIISVEDWEGAGTSTAAFALPTATALFNDCLDTHGDTKEFLFRNEASAAASTTLIVAGTNIVLTEASTTAGVVIAGGGSAIIKLWRLNATATSSGIQVNVEELRNAD